MIILSSSNLTNIKSMNKINHSWKGKIEINEIEYQWEQIATSNPVIFKIIIITPVQIHIDFEPHKNSMGQAISKALQLVT